MGQPAINLLFDLDGTLADPMEAFAGSLDYAFDALGVPRLPRERMRSLIGPPLHLALPGFVGGNEELAREALQLYREHHGETGIYDYSFYPGMDEALQRLRTGRRLFVATSKPKVYADRIFTHFGKGGPFEWIYGSELSGERSRKGELIAYAMAERGLNPAETVMIGDREHDVIGARENGLRSIGVTWGYGSSDELQRAGATHQVQDWSEILALV